jgi:hypothetical protein
MIIAIYLLMSFIPEHCFSSASSAVKRIFSEPQCV